ncbi:Hypothetical protein PHPALM_19844 [Phytophthora palmivora]|uniref:Uncharacterized protein n=1 Tax=Phytophthora palmivora TaxID=4796 RepID=A0A2P4XGC8_9STRA|nr:Hypothetical protein PHPALM_19844 [Phytophthora palmivora]
MHEIVITWILMKHQMYLYLRHVCGVTEALYKLLKLDQYLDTELRRVLEGYEKLIKNLKKRGVMKITRSKDTKLIKQAQKNLASMYTLIRMNPNSARYLLLICIYFPVLSALWLFIGGDKKIRFGRILRRVVEGLSDDEVCVLSCNPKDIGTHSLRKGGSSHAAGQVNGTFMSVKEQISFAVE